MITKADADRFTFREYHKIGTTKLSDEVLPVGTKVATREGEYTCAEPSRLALDAAGNVYPVAESIFAKSYELSPATRPEGEKMLISEGDRERIRREYSTPAGRCPKCRDQLRGDYCIRCECHHVVGPDAAVVALLDFYEQHALGIGVAVSPPSPAAEAEVDLGVLGKGVVVPRDQVLVSQLGETAAEAEQQESGLYGQCADMTPTVEDFTRIVAEKKALTARVEAAKELAEAWIDLKSAGIEEPDGWHVSFTHVDMLDAALARFNATGQPD